jgi:Domain of unknown function (DUF4126)
MERGLEQVSMIAMAVALAWASGVRLYAVLFLIGLAEHYHWYGWSAPDAFKVLAHPYVIAASGFMMCTEFLADKIPWFDSLWDAIHTFIRIPAGALLAVGALAPGDLGAWTVVAGLLGGGITAGTHFMKAGTRATLNTSPEPVSNWTASFGEDAAVLTGPWLAITHPLVFLGVAVLFLLLLIWLLPKLWRASCSLMRCLFGARNPKPA